MHCKRNKNLGYLTQIVALIEDVTKAGLTVVCINLSDELYTCSIYFHAMSFKVYIYICMSCPFY
jgi:hypothetical protein